MRYKDYTNTDYTEDPGFTEGTDISMVMERYPDGCVEVIIVW